MELSASQATDPFIGHLLAGRYDVMAKLGQGGLGAVYAAQQPPLGRKVAVKVLLREWTHDPAACLRFEAEAQAISRLNHPNIVSIFDLGAEDGQEFVAMEFLDGLALQDVIRRDAPLAPSRVVRIIMYVARALAAGHRAGILHRDLKPENIMLVQVAGEKDFVKVLDFGVSTFLRADRRAGLAAAPGHERRERALATHNAIRGRPFYMSPEHVNGVPADPRSDLYSLGVIAFEMLTGRVPFSGNTTVEIVMRHLQDARPSVAATVPGSPASPALDQLVQRLMAINPADRPAHAAQLLDMLEDLPEYTGPRTRLATASALPGIQSLVHDTVVDMPAAHDAPVPPAAPTLALEAPVPRARPSPVVEEGTDIIRIRTADVVDAAPSPLLSPRTVATAVTLLLTPTLLVLFVALVARLVVHPSPSAAPPAARVAVEAPSAE